MKKEIDGRGLDCPKPVIMTKKELDKLNEGLITTIVDNEVAKENVSKLAKSQGYEYSTENISDKEFRIHIKKGEGDIKVESSKEDKFEDLTIAFSSEFMGEGSEELGKILMKSFIYTLTEVTPYPTTLIFYNGGVHLTCEESEVLDDLRKLEQEGVEIISCGTCLDFYNKKDKVKVGDISNMYTIYESLKNPAKTINIG